MLRFMPTPWSATLLGRLCLLVLTVLLCMPVHAAYVKRYSTIANGAMTFTGNSLGLDKASNTGSTSNGPGTTGSIGTFMTTDTGSRDSSPNPGWPSSYATTYSAGTTASWANNKSRAQLRIPAGSTVLYAELIWGGNYQTTNENVSASYNGYVNFTPPGGATVQITPDAATTGTNFTLTGSGRYYYVRAREVTSYVKNYGAGFYEVGHVPGTQDGAEANANACGWTLAVVYKNLSLPARNMTLFLGAELTDSNQSPVSSVTGFATPTTGPVKGRMLVSAIEGDANITGDSMRFGSTNPPTNTVSSALNPSTNFFNSRINTYDESTNTLSVDTTGTYGTLNHSPGSPVSGGRQGWDITNVDVSSYLTNNQTTAYAQGTTNTDRYTITAIGLQINVGAPNFTPSTLACNRATTYVGDTLTYTSVMDNTTGTADATNCVFSNHGPNGLSFVAGSVTVNGVPQPAANVENGVNVGTIAKGASTTVVFQYRVNYIPPLPSPGSYSDYATWTYQYLSFPGFPLNNGTFTTNTVVTTIPQLSITKTNNPTTLLQLNDTVQYTITVRNNGSVASSGSTLRDPIPTGLTYVAGSTTLNGAALADVGGAMPFAAEREIHGTGDAAGVVGVGKTATVVFTGRCTAPQPKIYNTATLDPDGSAGPAPTQMAAVYNPAQSADLSVTISDGQAQVTAVAGATYAYTVQVSNAGPDTITACNLLLTYPTELQILGMAASAGAYDSNSGNWTGLNLAPGQSATVTVTVKLLTVASGTLTATAIVTNPPGYADPVTGNNTATDVDTINYIADLGIVKTNNTVVVLPSGTVTYQIRVSNYGPSSVDSVTITDTLPAVLQNVSYASSVGVFNTENGVWNAVGLDPGDTETLTITATVQASATGTLTNTASVATPAGVTDPNPNNNSSTDTDSIGYTISGTVYEDTDHNLQRNAGEDGLGIAGLYAKLIRSTGGNALQAVAVNSTSGVYQFANVSPNTYTVILDNNATLTDTTAYLPAGWIGTEQPTQRVTGIVLTNTNVADINIGLWHGSTVSGQVFNDNGTGGGTANNGIRDGGETALVAVELHATNAAGTAIHATATTTATGTYTLWIPFLTPATVAIREFNLPAYTSVGGTVGTLGVGSAYTRTTDITTFTFANGMVYTGVNFADVPANIFTNDGQRSAAPGATVFYTHVFTAGTGGQVTFVPTAVPTPNLPGWSVVIFEDINANGMIEDTDNPITGTRTVAAGTQIALVVKVLIPDNAPEGAEQALTLRANFTFSNAVPDLNESIPHTDLTTVSAKSNLALTLAVDKVTAKSGDILVYTLTYTNAGLMPLHDVVINNSTPGFTTFVSAAYGALPANLTDCTITTPAVGVAGGIRWSLVGTLAPGSSGTLSFQVKID
jgi:uncharacterized repeat protein (TIGR01451 family)